jgi:hypothetical protein
MIVHMALPLVLLLGILVSLVIMLLGRVVVLVTVDRHDGSFRIEPIRLGGTSSRAEGAVQSTTRADTMARRRSAW